MNSNNFSEKNLPIAYPGITVEAIPGTNNIYEITWNCGGVSVMLSSYGNNPELDSYIENIFQNVAKTHKQIIFICDNRVIANNGENISHMLENIFGRHNFALAGVEISDTEKNNINGLRVIRTKVSEEEDLVEKISALPDAAILSSLPFSDPRIQGLNEKISQKNLQNTFASRTLQLLELNALKANQTLIAPEEMGFIGMAQNADELQKIFQNHSEFLVLKEIEASAGGTNVNFVRSQAQREAVLKNASFPIFVFCHLESTHLVSEKGLHAMQFRPMISNDGNFMGGTLKMPLEALPQKVSAGAGKSTFGQQNDAFNTSSGLTHSIMLDSEGKPLVGYVSQKSGYEILYGNDVEKFLAQYSLENSQKPLQGDQIIRLIENILPIVKNIQLRTNQHLKLL